MKNLTYFLIAFCFTNMLWAQNPYSAIPLPNGSTMDKRLKMDLKIDDQQHTWIAFGTRVFGNLTFTSAIGLAEYDGTTWTNWNKDNSPLPTNSLTSIAIKGSVVWVGTLNGLAKKDGTTWTIYTKANSGILSDTVYDVSISNNAVWVATPNGVSKFNGTTWTNYTTATHAIADDKVNTILADKTGMIWIGTDKGLSRLSGTTWNSYNKTNSGLKTDKIYTLEQTSGGAVWIGTDTAMLGREVYGGLYTVQNNTIISANEYSGYCGTSGFGNPIYSIGIKGNHPIATFAQYDNAGKYKIHLVDLGPTAAIVYKNATYPWYPYSGGLLCAVSSSNKLYWCAREGLSADSLYAIDMNTYQESAPGETMSYLNINKISTPILNRGDMFWDLNIGGYEVPKGSCKRALFNSTLWMGGVSNNDLRIAAQTYRQNGNDYFAGPLRVGTATTDSLTIQQYDRIWRINRQTIEEFKVKFAEGKVTNGSYTVPENLMSWPAHGDVQNGFAAYLAPFVDFNNDGKYNPMDGDYPKIKGDQMLFWIFNDKGGIHSESMGKPFGFEIHASAYAFTCDQISDNDSNTALNYTTFYQYDIFNRSTEMFDSVKFGIWTDPDLGNYNDDYIECNPKKNYAFAYNGDDNDEGISGYGENPPAIGVAILDNHTDLNHMTGFRYYNNDFSSTGNPSRDAHYWNYLNTSWKDGSPLTYGGNGKGGSDTAGFMFPGNNDLAGRPLWSESSAQNAPGDRRMLPTVGGLLSVLPGSVHSFEYAIVFSRATSGGAMASVTKLDTDIDKVRNWYANQSFPSCLDLTTGLNKIKETPGQKLTLYPNPANQSIGLTIPGLTTDATYHIIDITGRILINGKASSQIDIQNLQPGVYFVEVRDGSNQYVSKFIKN